MDVLDRPLAPGSVTVLPPGLVACPALERAGSGVAAMTTPLSAQVSITNHFILTVYLFMLINHSCLTLKGGYWVKMRKQQVKQHFAVVVPGWKS